ncbi:putative remorin [Helianthus annuus]|uniref:Remorin n=1 Tax=Helianthus annuus TaxID=4232 RepID=A0A251T3W5_HELAN|nr:remorin 1.4 [Helianthus annuus]KAF5778680.1 putative remorin [Helianthus annuus]KAJ0675626.1 putative remorin [Helianthus annuus]KAJ0678904.1 putative remorin [Helianthus annuus]KAJ0863425.1 putative remorin [Helianthus annuus]
MENKLKQMRVKFSGIDDEMHQGETSHRKLTSQRSRSFNGDGRRVQNWYRGQSSRELTNDYDSDYMESDEFRTAVAAAAFAVNSAEERRRARRRLDGSLSRPKSKQEDGAVSVTRRIKERIPSSSSARNKMKSKEDDNVPIKTPSLLSRKFSELQEKLPQRASSPAHREPKPVAGLASTSGDQKPTIQPPPPPPPTEVDRKRPQLSPNDIKAEVWEKTELEKITERFDKLNAKILEWENEKKAKAKKKLSRNKDEPEKKRARALQSYKNDIEMIEQIVEAARSQAEENRRKDVIKIKKKADTIRLTGKIPTKTCLCF